MSGKLFIVGTPIGNLGDITLRAIETLKDADLILSEDTRRARKLIEKYNIKTRTKSYHKFNEAHRCAELVRILKDGKDVALISNAGMPLISDPGGRLVKAVGDEGIEITVVPGPSAVTAAVAVSGIEGSGFLFEGFLPAKTVARKKRLIELKYEPKRLIFFESATRLERSLDDMLVVLGRRKTALVRELTKLHEEAIRGFLDEILEVARNRSLRGEIVLVVEGYQGMEDWSVMEPGEHIEKVMEMLSVTRSEAIKLVARLRGIHKKELYLKKCAGK